MDWALDFIENHPLAFGSFIAWSGFILGLTAYIDAKRKLRFRTKFHGWVDARTQPVLFQKYLYFCIIVMALIGTVAVTVSYLAIF